MLAEFNDKCNEQYKCELELDPNWLTSECKARYEFYAAGSRYNQMAKAKNWNDWWRDKNRREPVFFAVAFCIADKIYNPITGSQMGMAK